MPAKPRARWHEVRGPSGDGEADGAAASGDAGDERAPQRERRARPREPRGGRRGADREQLQHPVGAGAADGAESRAGRGRGGRAARGDLRRAAHESRQEEAQAEEAGRGAPEAPGGAQLHGKVTRYTKGELLAIAGLPASTVKPDLDPLIDKENTDSQLLFRTQHRRPATAMGGEEEAKPHAPEKPTGPERDRAVPKRERPAAAVASADEDPASASAPASIARGAAVAAPSLGSAAAVPPAPQAAAQGRPAAAGAPRQAALQQAQAAAVAAARGAYDPLAWGHNPYLFPYGGSYPGYPPTLDYSGLSQLSEGLDASVAALRAVQAKLAAASAGGIGTGVGPAATLSASRGAASGLRQHHTLSQSPAAAPAAPCGAKAASAVGAPETPPAASSKPPAPQREAEDVGADAPELDEDDAGCSQS